MNKWEKYKIHELGSVVTGSTPKTTIEEYWNGNIPFVSPTDMKGYKNIVNTERTVTIDGAQTGRLIPKGSLMVTCIASIGKMAISDRECITNQQINTIIPNNKCTVDYLYYALLKNIDRLKLFSGTTAVPIINKSTFEQFELEIPPLREQQKIAEILSSVDAAIEKTEQVIAKTEEVKKGLMQQLLTKGIGHTEFKQTEFGEIPVSWEVKKISQVASTMSGGTPNRKKSEYYNGDIPWVKTGELIHKYLNNSEEKITELGLNNSSAKLMPVGAVLIAMYGATVGKSTILGISASTNQACCGIIPNKDYLNNEYLYYRLQYWKDKLISMATGAAQPNISQQLIKELLIPLPNLSEQEKIVDILNIQDEKIANEKANLDSLKEIKQGLMQRLLTGQVRVQID